MGAPATTTGRLVAGKYARLRRLAAGGMGDVWLARNEATQAMVALKTLRRSAGDDPAVVAAAEARFRHEARVSARFSHRNVIRAFDLVEEQDGALVLVMELLRGESLQRWLARVGPRSTREAVALMGPVLLALGHAHEAGIVHRDVTPGNVFLAVEPDGVVPKLVDFGIAKPAGDGRAQTLDGTVLGTPRYMAPEQIRGGALDGRADVFSAAVVLHEIITGACPFAGPTPAAELAAVLEGVVDADPRIEPRVWLELQRALSKRPYERHASAQELARALASALGESEASLAEVRAAAPAPLVTDPDVELETGPRTMEGQSLASASPRRRLGGPVWLLGAGLFLSAALASGLAVMGLGGRGVAPTPSAPPTPAAAPTREADADAPAVVAPARASPQPSTTPAAAPPRGGSAATAATRPPRPRPVATTPGF